MRRMSARFALGQTVFHRGFRYRGIVVDVEPPPVSAAAPLRTVIVGDAGREPWYHVLVDGADAATRVAERWLAADPTAAPVDHPDLHLWLTTGEHGGYRTTALPN